MNESKELSATDKSLVDELFKQIGTQAALFAGFTFGILALVDFNAAPDLSFWLVLCIIITIALELLAAVLSGALVFLTKLETTAEMSDAFKWQTRTVLASYLIGIVSFIASVILLIWIKFPAIKITAVVILGAVVVFGAFLLIAAVRTHDRIANPDIIR